MWKSQTLNLPAQDAVVSLIKPAPEYEPVGSLGKLPWGKVGDDPTLSLSTREAGRSGKATLSGDEFLFPKQRQTFPAIVELWDVLIESREREHEHAGVSSARRSVAVGDVVATTARKDRIGKVARPKARGKEIAGVRGRRSRCRTLHKLGHRPSVRPSVPSVRLSACLTDHVS